MLLPAHQERETRSSSLLPSAKLSPSAEHWHSVAVLAASGCATDSKQAPSCAPGGFSSLPCTQHELAEFWGTEHPAEGTLLSHRCERGAGPAPESLTRRAYKASTGACSPTHKSHTTPGLLCFSFMLVYSSTASAAGAVGGWSFTLSWHPELSLMLPLR